MYGSEEDEERTELYARIAELERQVEQLYRVHWAELELLRGMQESQRGEVDLVGRLVERVK